MPPKSADLRGFKCIFSFFLAYLSVCSVYSSVFSVDFSQRDVEHVGKASGCPRKWLSEECRASLEQRLSGSCSYEARPTLAEEMKETEELFKWSFTTRLDVFECSFTT